SQDSCIQNKQRIPWTNIAVPQDPTVQRNVGVAPFPPTIAELAQAGFPSGNLYTYTWESPFFDLRPDLKSVDGQPAAGVPIWDRGARLYVHVGATADPDPSTIFTFPIVLVAAPGLPTFLRSDQLFAWSREEYNPNSLDRGQQLPAFANVAVGAGPWTNISSTLFPTTPFLQLGASEAIFSPPGTASGAGIGHPIRYWKVVINFWQFRPSLNNNTVPATSTIAPMPTFLQAGMY
ncbi:MAG: hypothetical protein Q8R92_05320, partial [Deltaproteobacteria bacterium]|nr:hypothetical protein [Deltaproteobacteria bacterium]